MEKNGESHTWVLHPVFAALFPAFFYYGHNLSGFDPGVMVRPILVCLGLAAVATWVAGRLAGGVRRGALITSGGILALFAYGYIYNGIEGLGIYFNANGWSAADAVFALMYGAILFGWAFFVARIKSLDAWTRFMNTWTIILVAFPAVHIVNTTFRLDSVEERGSDGRHRRSMVQ